MSVQLNTTSGKLTEITTFLSFFQDFLKIKQFLNCIIKWCKSETDFLRDIFSPKHSSVHVTLRYVSVQLRLIGVLR